MVAPPSGLRRDMLLREIVPIFQHLDKALACRHMVDTAWVQRRAASAAVLAASEAPPPTVDRAFVVWSLRQLAAACDNARDGRRLRRIVESGKVKFALLSASERYLYAASCVMRHRYTFPCPDSFSWRGGDRSAGAEARADFADRLRRSQMILRLATDESELIADVAVTAEGAVLVYPTVQRLLVPLSTTRTTD